MATVSSVSNIFRQDDKKKLGDETTEESSKHVLLIENDGSGAHAWYVCIFATTNAHYMHDMDTTRLLFSFVCQISRWLWWTFIFMSYFVDWGLRLTMQIDSPHFWHEMFNLSFHIFSIKNMSWLCNEFVVFKLVLPWVIPPPPISL